jgi:hypothetical protein
LMVLMAVANGANAVNAASSATSSNTAPLLPGASATLSTMTSATAANSLTWTQGRAYPVVDGKVVPPPLAPASSLGSGAAPQTVGGHWYVGSVSSGISGLASWILSEISIPSAGQPDSGIFYYVLTSVWDNAASYDQIGFTDDYGVWGLTYSYTSGMTTSCAGTLSYHFSPDAKAMIPGQEYLLAMTTVSGGVWFEVYTVSATGAISLYYSLHAATGASSLGLQLQPFYCGYYNYTDYQEVWGTTTYTQPDPYGAPVGLQFFFHENCYDLNGVQNACGTYTNWAAWASGSQPNGAAATISQYGTANELVDILSQQELQGFAPG